MAGNKPTRTCSWRFLVNPPRALTEAGLLCGPLAPKAQATTEGALRPNYCGSDKQAQGLLPPCQGVSKAMDGRKQAHTDVLVASP
jgi:hypothetical protein